MLKIQTFEVNPLQENCYVVSDETKECVIIDCGALTESEQNSIIDYIKGDGLTPILVPMAILIITLVMLPFLLPSTSNQRFLKAIVYL